MLNLKQVRQARQPKAFTVLVAPSGFKESLGAREVSEHIATGILRVMPEARVLKAPMVDGGEGFTEALVEATGGALRTVRVTGPVGEPVDSFFGFLGGRARKHRSDRDGRRRRPAPGAARSAQPDADHQLRRG